LASADVRALVLVALLAASASAWARQSMTISTTGGVLAVQAPGFGFIEGEVLGRLRDGRSLRIDFELSVLSQPAGAAIAKGRQSFNLSYDLWEERFAVTRIGTPSRSVSHLKIKDSEAWCLEHLTVPLTELSRIGRSSTFWLRLEYRVPEDAGADSDAAFSVRSLIDAFSRKRRDGQLGKSIQAGPFRFAS